MKPTCHIRLDFIKFIKIFQMSLYIRNKNLSAIILIFMKFLFWVNLVKTSYPSGNIAYMCNMWNNPNCMQKLVNSLGYILQVRRGIWYRFLKTRMFCFLNQVHMYLILDYMSIVQYVKYSVWGIQRSSESINLLEANLNFLFVWRLDSCGYLLVILLSLFLSRKYIHF